MARVATSGRVASTRTGNILYNGNFEIKPPVLTAQTNVANVWINGAAAGATGKLGYGWGIKPASVTASADAGWDTTVFRSGAASMRLSTLDAVGKITVATVKSDIASTTAYQFFPLLPSTAYTVRGYIKTNNVAASAAYIDMAQINTSNAITTVSSTSKLSGTNDWTLVTVSFTTAASTKAGHILLRNNVAGNISDAWFDDITVIPSTTGRVAATGRVAP